LLSIQKVDDDNKLDCPATLQWLFCFVLLNASSSTANYFFFPSDLPFRNIDDIQKSRDLVMIGHLARLILIKRLMIIDL